MRAIRLLDVSQHETVRVNFKKNPDVNILLTGLEHCVVVVFKDKVANVSATHVDVVTDLKFIETEAKQMQEGFTVDIIKNPDTTGKLAEKVFAHVKEFLHVESAIEKTGAAGMVWISKEKFRYPSQKSVDDLQLTGQVHLDEGGRSIRRRFHERFLTTLLDPEEVCPVVVFDSGWTGKYVALSSKTKKIIDHVETYADQFQYDKFLRDAAIKALGH